MLASVLMWAQATLCMCSEQVGAAIALYSETRHPGRPFARWRGAWCLRTAVHESLNGSSAAVGQPSALLRDEECPESRVVPQESTTSFMP